MRAILSHDVDNLTRLEHKEDKIILKMVIRGFLEFGLFKINFSTLRERLKLIKDNNLNNIEELTDFDKQYNTKATYFFATANDSTLAYCAEDTVNLVNIVKSKGLNVGVHGIEYNSLNNMKREFEKFKKLHNVDKFGIRMHYLRRNENTLGNMKEVGYLFDTTEYSDKEIKQPYITEEGIVEFPTHIMDGYLFQDKGIQKYNLDQAKKITKDIIDNLLDKDVIFIINFHQEYFSDGWKDWKEWYIWFVKYCKENGVTFVDYQEVVDELTSK